MAHRVLIALSLCLPAQLFHIGKSTQPRHTPPHANRRTSDSFCACAIQLRERVLLFETHNARDVSRKTTSPEKTGTLTQRPHSFTSICTLRRYCLIPLSYVQALSRTRGDGDFYFMWIPSPFVCTLLFGYERETVASLAE